MCICKNIIKVNNFFSWGVRDTTERHKIDASNVQDTACKKNSQICYIF